MTSSVDYAGEWKKLGLVLDHFNRLELQMSVVIRAYVRPSQDRAEFMEAVVLHNSLLSFAAKVKIVLAIARESSGPALDREALHRMLNIRNALAHGHTMSNLRVNANAFRDEPYGAYLVIESMKGDGSFEARPRLNAINEFFDLYDRVEQQLKELERHVARTHDA